MKPERRRKMIMAVIIALGLVLIMFDLPTELVLAGAFAAGMAMIAGAGRIASRREGAGKKMESKSVKETGNMTATAMEKGRKRSGSGVVPGWRGVLRRLSGIPAYFMHHFRLLRGREVEEKKIDRILDELIEQNPVKGVEKVTGGVATPIPTQKVGETDPFASLAGAEVDREFLAPAEVQRGEDPVLQNDAARMDLSPKEGGRGLQLDKEADEVEEILKSYGMELGAEESDQAGNALADLKEIEFGEIDLDAIIPESGDAPAGSRPPGVDVTTAPSPSAIRPDAPSPPAREKVKEEQTPPLSAETMEAPGLSLPGSGEGEFISLLKSDAAKVKVERDISLLRDLKDERCRPEELIGEMEQVLAALPARVEADSTKSRVRG